MNATTKNPPKWSQITSHKKWQEAPSEERAKIRDSYFQDFVAPTLGPVKSADAYVEFLGRTATDITPPEQPGLLGRAWGSVTDAAGDAVESIGESMSSPEPGPEKSIDQRANDIMQGVKAEGSPKWTDLTRMRDFQQADWQTKQRLRADYFDNVVLPSVPPEKSDEARSEFFTRTEQDVFSEPEFMGRGSRRENRGDAKATNSQEPTIRGRGARKAGVTDAQTDTPPLPPELVRSPDVQAPPDLLKAPQELSSDDPDSSIGGRAAQGMLNRATDLMGSLPKIAGRAIEGAEAKLDETFGRGGGVIFGTIDEMRAKDYEPDFSMGNFGIAFTADADPEDTSLALEQLGEAIQGTRKEPGYQFTIDRFWKEPSVGNAIGMAAEQGPAALVDMGAMLLNLPAYTAARTQEIAEDRSSNQSRWMGDVSPELGLAMRENFVMGKPIPAELQQEMDRLESNAKPTSNDYAVAAPAAALVASMDRISFNKWFPGAGKAITKLNQLPASIARGAGIEGFTEAVQEGGIEYGASTVGTRQGWTPEGALQSGTAGAIIGAPVGGGVAGTSGAIQASLRQQQSPVLQDPIEEARRTAATQGGDALDQTMAGQQAEQAESQAQNEEQRLAEWERQWRERGVENPAEGDFQTIEVAGQQRNAERSILDRTSIEAAINLVRQPRSSLNQDDRAARDSITYGEGFQALRAIAEQRGDADAVNALDLMSQEAGAALEEETLSRTTGDPEGMARAQAKQDIAADNLARAAQRLSGQQSANVADNATAAGEPQQPQEIADRPQTAPEPIAETEEAVASTDLDTKPREGVRPAPRIPVDSIQADPDAYQFRAEVNEIQQAGFSDNQSEQGGLFGDDPSQSLISERVKVMDALHKDLSSNRRLFATLNRNARTAEGAGNQIATERNQEMSDTAALAMDLLSRVTTDPEMNQQINDAARRVNEGQPVARAVAQLKEVLLRGPDTASAQPDRAPDDSGRPAQAGRRGQRADQQEPAADDTRAEGAGEQRLAGDGALQAEGRLSYRANGQPFATEASALASGTARRGQAQGQQVEAVPVDGGFAVRIENVDAMDTTAGRVEETPDDRQDNQPPGRQAYQTGEPRRVPRDIRRQGDDAAKAWYEGWDRAQEEDNASVPSPANPNPKTEAGSEAYQPRTKARRNRILSAESLNELNDIVGAEWADPERTKPSFFVLQTAATSRWQELYNQTEGGIAPRRKYHDDDRPERTKPKIATSESQQSAETQGEPRFDIWAERQGRAYQTIAIPAGGRRPTPMQDGSAIERLISDIPASAWQEARQMEGRIPIERMRREAKEAKARATRETGAESQTLETQTEESLAERERAQQQAEQAGDDGRRQEEQRAQADTEADDFRLSGRDRQADVAAADGQDALFSLVPRQQWRSNLPDVALAHRLNALNNHPDYQSAKAGDDNAALRVARDLVTPEFVEQVRAMIPEGSTPRVVPVLAMEAAGNNRIPLASAYVLANRLGLEPYNEILQEQRVSRSGANALERLAKQPSFEGELAPGDYLLIDDTLTQGGTLAQLKAHIENQGGSVVGAAALTGKQYSAKLSLNPATLESVRDRFGSIENWWRDTFGYGFDGLTQSEARTLLTFDGGRLSPEQVRDRVTARGDEALRSVDEGTAGDRPGPQAPVTPSDPTTPSFRIGEPGEASPGDALLSVEEAEAALQGYDDALGAVNVVRSTSQLPADVLLSMKALGVSPMDVKGVHHNGEVYIVAAAHDNAQEALRTAVHEAVGHKGMRGVLGEDLDRVMLGLFRSLPNSPEGRAALAEVRRDYPFLDPSKREDRITIGEEMVAHLLEKGHRPKAWQRAVAKIRELLRRLFPSIAWTHTDALALGEQSREYLRRQAAERQAEQARPTITRYSQRSGENKLFTPIQQEAEAYREALDKAMTSLRSVAPPIQMGRTPPVLASVGAPDLPMFITRDVVRKSTNGAKHHVAMETIQRLPELLHDPVAVFDSRTEQDALVVLVNAVDADGKPMLIPLHLNKRQRHIQVNRVASAYGKNGVQGLVAREVAEGRLRYVNTKQSPEWFQSSRLQLPGGGTPSRGSESNPSLVRLIGLQLPGSGSPNQGSDQSILTPDDIGKSDIRFSLRNSENGAYGDNDSTNFAIPDETRTAAFLRNIQDKFVGMKRLQSEIKRSSGMINDDNDVYLAEELYYGKTERDLRQMEESFIKPLMNGLAESGISQSDLDSFMYARHAPERNARIAKRNPDDPSMQDGGSGMTNARAAEIVEAVENSGKRDDFERLASIVSAMLDRRRQALREGGLMSDDQIEARMSGFDHYVPLKGWANDEDVPVGEQKAGRPGTGRGFEASGKDSRIALGRKTVAASPTTQAIVDTTESIIRARKNEVAQSLLSLITDNPNPKVWQVFTEDSPDMERKESFRIDPETGERRMEVTQAAVNMAQSDRYFRAKRNGRNFYIKINDQQLMDTLRNVGVNSSHKAIEHMASVIRVMSSLVTSYNPEFMVTNFVRDAQTAMLNIQAEQSRDDGRLLGKKIGMGTARDMKSAMAAAYRGLSNKKGQGEHKEGWDRWFNEFMQSGAKTGYFDVKDVERQAKDLERMMKSASSGMMGATRRTAGKTVDFVENLNGAVENAVRLSAYKNAREAGLSKRRAASLAKNMTVNFNRRGEMSTFMGALYMFFNAAVQGTANFVRTMGGFKALNENHSKLNVVARLNTAQRLGLGMAVAGYGMASLMRMIADEDEDGVSYWDKVPDYVKERNFVIMTGWATGDPKDYIALPLPYGYNIFPMIGTQLEGLIHGSTTLEQAAINTTLGIMGSFNPVGFEESEEAEKAAIKTFTPTIAGSFAQIAVNENFFGGPIYKPDYQFGTPSPDSSRSFRSTPEPYKRFAEFLNKWGGNDYESGIIDISPDTLQHLVNYYGGGAWGFGEKTADFAYRAATGDLDNIDPKRIPFLGRVSGEADDTYQDQSDFYNRQDELGQKVKYMESLSGPERRRAFQESPQAKRLFERSNDLAKRLSKIRDIRDNIESNEKLPEEIKEERIKRQEKLMEQLIDRWSKDYNETIGD